MAGSFIKTCNEYIRTAKLRKKAMQVWKDALQTDLGDDIKNSCTDGTGASVLGKAIAIIVRHQS